MKKKDVQPVEAPAETTEGTVEPQPTMLEPVKISEMPTKRKAERRPLSELEEIVFEFVQKCNRGDVYTAKEAAEKLELTELELTEALSSLTHKRFYGKPTGHITI